MVCSIYDTKRCEVHLYKPSSSGAVERANRKAKDALKTVVDLQMVDWNVALEDLQFTLNNTVNEMTGYTAHFIPYDYQKCMSVALLNDTLLL